MGKDIERNDESIVLNKPSDEDDFDGVSVSFVRFEEMEDNSFQEFKNKKEEENK